jgi:hypothetical protein
MKEGVVPEEEFGEPCMDCQEPCLGWASTDEHWQAVMGEWAAGILCPRCFTYRSEALGLPCRWDAIQTDEDEWHKSPAYPSIRQALLEELGRELLGDEAAEAVARVHYEHLWPGRDWSKARAEQRRLTGKAQAELSAAFQAALNTLNTQETSRG